MEFWTNVILFLLILFFYIHLQYQFKTGEDLEIYELDYVSNQNLQEVIHLKQPVLFQIDHLKECEPFFKAISLDEFVTKKYANEDVCVKDIREFSTENTTIDGISLSFSSAYGLMQTDPKGYFFSENNEDVVQNLSFPVHIMDSILKSPWSLYKTCDWCFGSNNVKTPLRWHTDSAKYIVVSEGAGIRVKMTPWKSRKFLDFHFKKDYENYEFWSSIDIWNLSLENCNKIKCLEFDVKGGFVLFVPAYWLYSIQYLKPNETSTAPSCLSIFTYHSPMNMIANAKNYGLYWLQQSNIHNMSTQNVKVVSKLDEEMKTDTTVPSEENKITTTTANNTDTEISQMLDVIKVNKSE